MVSAVTGGLLAWAAVVPAASASIPVPAGGPRTAPHADQKAATANGTATRKMWPVASPKACSKSARTGPGRVLRSGIEWLSEESCPGALIAARPPAVTVAATWWLSTAPSAETPIEPPRLRQEGHHRAGRAHVGLRGVVLDRDASEDLFDTPAAPGGGCSR